MQLKARLRPQLSLPAPRASIDLPAACCSAPSVVLSDEGMGEVDSKTNFKGDSILAVDFFEVSLKGDFCFLMGEYRLIEKDL
jgi:hypothetical protein